MCRNPAIDNSTSGDHCTFLKEDTGQENCRSSYASPVADNNRLATIQQPSQIEPVLINHRPSIVTADNSRPYEHLVAYTRPRMELCAMANQTTIPDRGTVYD